MANEPLGVLLGGSSILRRRSGVGRMALEIARAVQAHPDVGDLRLLVGGRLLDLPENLSDGAGSDGAGRISTLLRRAMPHLARVPGVERLRALPHQWQLRAPHRLFDARWQGRVVYHEPNMIPLRFPGTTVITVNDLSWHHHPAMHPVERIAWIGRNLSRALRQASRVVAISRFTADAVVADLGVPRDRVDVVPLAVSAAFRPHGAEEAAAILDRQGLADRGYVLSVSTLEPRKNFDGLLAAHAGLPLALRRRFPLVIAGGTGWGRVLGGGAAAAALRDGTLRLLGHVPDAELVALYARAAAFAYVSLYEGFGLPVLEAMATGTPVVASSTTAVGEVAAGAALLVDPHDPATITAALRQVLEDPDTATALREQGLSRAAQYSWHHTADGLVASWRRALAMRDA